MAELSITTHETETGGEYRAQPEGSDHTGKLEWRNQGDNVRNANHTLVPREIGGQGIAAKLVNKLIADAREQGFKIVPSCSYVEKKFDENPDWSDLRAK